MRRHVLWALLGGLVLAVALPGSASAAPCGDAAEALNTSVSPYVVYGGQVDIALENISVDATVDGLSVTIGDVATLLAVPDYTDGSTDGTATAPKRAGTAAVVFTWRQTATNGAVCEGRDDYTTTVLAKGKKLGDPDLPRISGRWRFTFTPLNYDGKFSARRWTVTPSCQIGACDLHILSSSKRRFHYVLGDDNHYRRKVPAGPRPQGDCMVTRRRGGQVISRHVIHHAFLISERADLRVTSKRRRGRFLEATRVEGTADTIYTPTGPARAHQCSRVIVERDRVFGTR